VPVTHIHLGIADGLDDVVGQFAGGEDLPVAALATRLFIGGDHDGAITAVAGDDHGWARAMSWYRPTSLPNSVDDTRIMLVIHTSEYFGRIQVPERTPPA
jgi:hypothetical protein